MATFQIDADELRPLVEAVLKELLDRFPGDDRLAFSEAEAARMLSLPRHSLRDARLRGRITGFKVGNRVRYSRRTLLDFIAADEGR